MHFNRFCVCLLQLAQHLHIGSMGSLDSEDNQKATTEQIKKKQQAKKDADDEIRSKWLEEVGKCTSKQF